MDFSKQNLCYLFLQACSRPRLFLVFFFFFLPDGVTIPTPKPIIFQLASKINFHTSYANTRMTEMLNIC